MRALTLLDLFVVAAVVAVGAGETLRDRLRSGGGNEPDGPIERVHRAYERDEIGVGELEHRVGILTDPDRRAVYDLVRRVDYAGHGVALRVAREYESVDDVATADRSELEAVHGVGPSTADAILQDVRA